jgi:hypothetical protein
MKNFFLACSLLFGVGTSAVSSYWGAIDMYQLDKAFKAGDWNKGRIECRKDKIKTLINGVKAAEVTDAMTPSGIIGLQVHGIGKGKAPGDEVRWRNIRIKEL